MNWLEVKIYTSSEGVEPVCGRLMVVGVTGFVIRDSKDFEEFLENKTGNWDYIDDDLMGLKSCETCVTFYLADNSQGADTFILVKNEMAELSAYDTEKKFGRLAIEINNVREEDWADNWKQYFKPFNVGERLIVKPSWENCENTEGKTILEIDPASSFGTGQHATTRLCLELLEQVIKTGDRVLDIGCGSGILSIGAVLLGAEYACAVDIDLNSVKIAGENALKNNIPPEKYITLNGNIIDDPALRERIGGGYDIITANIVADVLIAMSGLFGDHLNKDGKLMISGIITERSDEVLSAMEKNGFYAEEIKECDGWAAVRLTRK